MRTAPITTSRTTYNGHAVNPKYIVRMSGRATTGRGKVSCMLIDTDDDNMLEGKECIVVLCLVQAEAFYTHTCCTTACCIACHGGQYYVCMYVGMAAH